jgi:alpha-glucoside transport system permease protein
LFLTVAVPCLFFATLLVVFWLASKTKARFQTPLARLIFLGPAAVLLFIGLVIPALQTFWKGFLNDDSTKWIGLKNYSWIFATPDNRTFLINTLLWIIITPIFSTALGLTLALLLDRMKRESLPKSLIFMPMAISFVGASIIWNLVYSYKDPSVSPNQTGLLSAVMIKLGLSNPPNWILWQPWNNFLLMVIMIWIQTGFAMVILSAALKSIPDEIIESARLDGASGLTLFRTIQIPMIRNTIVVVMTTVMITTLKVFDIVFTINNGNFNTDVLARQMYADMFVTAQVSRGSALAVILFVAVIPLIWYNVRTLRRERENS